MYHPKVDVNTVHICISVWMFIFFYTSSLPKNDDSRIGVNIQNKDGKEMNIQETMRGKIHKRQNKV